MEPLNQIRIRAQEALSLLPNPTLRIERPEAPTITVSERLRKLAIELDIRDGKER